MSDTYQPKHRKHVLTKTRPRLQPAPRHRSDRLLERLGAEAPDVKALSLPRFDADEFKSMLHDITVGNPFGGRR